MMPPYGGGRDITAKTTYAPNGTENLKMSGGGSPFMDLYYRWLRNKVQPARPVQSMGMGVNQVGGQEEAQDAAMAGQAALRARFIAEEKAKKAKFTPIYGQMVPAGMADIGHGIQWKTGEVADPNSSVVGYRQAG
jgi:hypothetical protein